MSLKFVLLCVTLCICFQNVRSKQPKGYYTIVAPGTIRSNSIYQVSVSLSDFHQSCSFNITINLKYDRFYETVKVEPRTTKLLRIPIPFVDSGLGTLEVFGFQGILTRESSAIITEDRHYTVYIQTDKAKYKPGERVQFRVICIDRLTRPAKVYENIVVLIYDGQKNLVKEFYRVKLVQGVFKGDLQLSEYPLLGEWKIEVSSNGRSMQERSFQVARYVPPKFSVNIITKKDVAVDEGQIVVTVKAAYTYGEPIKGSLTVLLNTLYSAVKDSRPRIMKESQIDGEITISFDLKTDLNITRNPNDRHSIILYTFGAECVVQDTLTKQNFQSKTEISIHNHPYSIRIEAPRSFEPDSLAEITISVTDLQNNPIQDKKNPVKLTIEGSFSQTKSYPEAPLPKRIDVYLNEKGVGAASLNLTNDGYAQYRMIAEYLGWISSPRMLEKNERNTFTLDILTERPEVGKELVIQLKSIDPIEYFVYEIVSRGDIIKSEHISVPGNETLYLLSINATYSMVPKITLFIHRVKDTIFDSRLKEVYIKRAFQNSIMIDTDDEVKPGESVSVNVTTDEGSYVGLMGLDQKLLLDSNNKGDLNEDHIFTELRNYDSLNMNTEEYPGFEAGLITFSNSYKRDGSRFGEVLTYHILSGEPDHPLPNAFDNPSVQLPRIRKIFSESWIFKDFERTPSEGLKLHETIPDTITSWAITGFSLNPNTGLTLTRNATILKVFQAFFISMDLPSLVKQGEIIEIPVYVYNYMDHELLTDVTVDQPSADIELLDELNSKSKVQTNKTISKSIAAQGKAKLVFLIRPHKPGRYNLTVKAISPKASDAVQKTLIVASEGVPYSFSKTYLAHFHEENEQDNEISVDIPQSAVPGSESVQLSVIGDILGPLMRSLEDLVRVPYGNGEDNIKYIVSNLLVLKYLKVLNHSNPSLENKAKLHLELGYQNQLSFKHLDGSFSFLDRTTEITGDVWLTAYVMWGLEKATQFIPVDRQLIDRGLNYLKSKQAENGSFSSGRGVDEDVALTAFTLLPFMLYEKISRGNPYQMVIKTGLTYLYETLNNLKKSIPSVMSTYALFLGKHEKAEELLAKLRSPASLTSQQIIPPKSDTLQSNLEMTAASFMSLFDSQTKPVQTLLPIVRALITPGQGEKIPTHMIALEAMIEFAQDMDFGSKDLNIHFNDNQGSSGDFHVNINNAQVLQTIMLNETSRNVHLQAKGKGFAIVNIKYTYNLLSVNQSLSNYETNITVKQSLDRIVALEACVSLRSGDIESNLTAMEINLQSGYTFDGRTLDEVQKTKENIRAIQVNGNEGSILVYIQNIAKNGDCIQLEALKMYNVVNPKPATVVVYDVHKDYERSISFFQYDLSKAGLSDRDATS